MKKLVLFISLFSFFAADAQVLLYDQTDSVTTGGILCREHTTATSAQFNTEGADDFTIPSGQVWRIDSVRAQGFYNATPDTNTPTVVTIYSDDNGEPDAVVETRRVQDGDYNDDGDLEPFFEDDPIFLEAGTYWLSVKIDTSTFPWYWARINALETVNPMHWYNPGGGYAVCTSWQPLFTCISSITDSSANFQLYGCINPPQLTGFIEDTAICEGNSVTINLNPNTSNVSYQWSSGETGNSVTVDSTMEYTITVTNTTTNCASLFRSSILVNENPELADVENDTVCEGDLGFFDASGSACTGLCQYVWDGDTAITPFYNTSQGGWHTIQVVDASTGCFSQLDSAWLEAEVATPPTMSPDSGFYICDGDTGVISVVNAYDTYQWSIGSDSNAIIVLNAGDYYVTVTTALGCEAFDSVSVEVKALPTTTISTSITGSFNTKLKAGEGFESYLWSNGDDDSETTVSSDGQYSVTVTDSFGCEGVTTIFVTVIPSGIEEANNDGLKVFPNPTDAFLNVQWTESSQSARQLELLDATGRIVLTQTALSNTEQLDLSNIPSGFYLLNVRSESGMESVQILRH
jgi:hypothetical protein